MQTVGELMKLLAGLDPNTPMSYSLWMRPPGKQVPPKRLDGEAKAARITIPKKKLNDSQLMELRARVIEGMNLTDVGKKFGVHRATVSRYIQDEIKAGRLGKLVNGQIVAAKGAYDLETGAAIVRSQG